jgi:uncharacterized protein
MNDSASDETPRNRRILSIDGGGILGTFPAAFLAGLEGNLNRPIGDYFDLLVGTSTGGIIATGLAHGMRAAEVLKFYEEQGPSIFFDNHRGIARRLFRTLREIRHVGVSKYDSIRLENSLRAAFVETKIGDLKRRLVLPAWNPDLQRVYIYKTPHHPRLQFDRHVSLVDATMATASAPTFFPQHFTEQNVGLIDGGVWANNPIAVAVVEAISLLGWDAKSLDVLSLGCLDEIYRIPINPGWGRLNKDLISLFMDGQKHGAMGMAKLLTGHGHERNAIHRITHTVLKDQFKLDDTSSIRTLKGLGLARAREQLPHLQKVFFDRPAEGFQPFPSSATGAAE